jgi:hypothetical protein
MINQIITKIYNKFLNIFEYDEWSNAIQKKELRESTFYVYTKDGRFLILAVTFHYSTYSKFYYVY